MNAFSARRIYSSPVTGRQSGMAIGLILVAVALIATLGVTIALSSLNNYGTNYTPKKDALATAVINQGRNLRAGIATMTANGTAISSITLDTSGGTGLYNPSSGGVEPQSPNPAMLANSSATWTWKVDGSGNPVVKLYNVGNSANADYVMALPYIDPYTCTSIDNILHGITYTPQLAASVASDWQTAATSIDLSASNSGTQGWTEGCYMDSSGSNYVYVMTVRPQ